MDWDGGIVKNEEVVSRNAESNNGSGCSSSIFVGPENVTIRISCIISRYGGVSLIRRMADSDNEIGNYLNLMPNFVDGSSPMENKVVANNSNVGRDFGYAELVGSAIHEVDTNSIPKPPTFRPLKHEVNKVDEYPRKRFLRKYGADQYPRNKQNFVHSTNGCCCLFGDWTDDSSKITDCMNRKLISEALQIGSTSHEVKTNNNLISEDGLPKTFVPEYDAAQPSEKKQKHVDSTSAYCFLSSDWSDNSSAIRDSASSSLGSKFEMCSKNETEGGILVRKTSRGLHLWFGEDKDYYFKKREDEDYFLGGDARNLEEHVNDVIRRMD